MTIRFILPPYAKLDAIAARTETKLELLLAELRREIPDLRKEMAEVKSDNKATRWTIIVTVVVVATLAALAAL